MFAITNPMSTYKVTSLPQRRRTDGEPQGVVEKVARVVKHIFRFIAAVVFSFIPLLAVPISYAAHYFRSSNKMETLVDQQRKKEVNQVSSAMDRGVRRELKLNSRIPAKEQVQTEVTKLTVGMKARSSSPKAKQAHKKRVYMRALARQGIRVRPDFDNFKKYQDILTKQEVRQEIAQGPRPLNDTEIREFKLALKGLIDACLIKEFGEPKNNEIVLALRKVQACEAYQVLKTDIEDPAIAFVHKMAVNLFTEPRAMDSMQKLGNGLLQEATENGVEQTSEGAGFSRDLCRSQAKAAEHLYHNDTLGGFLEYTFTHVDQARASLSSVGNHFTTFLSGKAYDTRGGINEANNASAQSDLLTVQESGKEVTVRTIYGGSPTSGPYIQAEFLLLLQAVENNQFLANPDEQLPHAVAYTNLQSIGKGGEGERSDAIMHLNKDFPLSFRGMTLPKDTTFYGSSKKDTLYFSSDKEQRWNGSESFGEEFKESLLNGAFTLGARNHHTQGSYFPGTKAEWSPVIDEALSEANRHFNSVEHTKVIEGLLKEIPFEEVKNFLEDKTAAGVIHAHLTQGKILPVAYQSQLDQVKEAVKSRMMRSAYQEYVYTLLEMYFEQNLSKTLGDNGVDKPFVLAIRACKENIDRGGSENAKFLYLELGDEYSESVRRALVAAAFHGRSLSSRNRVILKHRISHFLHLVSLVKPREFKDAQSRFLEKTGVKIRSSRLVPLGETPFKSLLERVSPKSDDELIAWTAAVKKQEKMSLSEIAKASRLVRNEGFLDQKLRQQFLKSLSVHLLDNLDRRGISPARFQESKV